VDLERLGLTYVSVFDVHERGIGAAVERALKAIHRDKIYLTIDIDGVDPAFARPSAIRSRSGSPHAGQEGHRMLAPDLVGMDLNEVSPAWDFAKRRCSPRASFGRRSWPLARRAGTRMSAG